MKRLIAASLVVALSCSAAAAEQVVQEISWQELADAGKLLAGQVQQAEPPEGRHALKVDNQEGRARTIPVALIEKPDLQSPRYQVAGWVKHEEVAAGSYLEMWSTFGDGGRYFSRTLSPSGPMRNLDGSSDWRPFILPFQGDEKTGPPNRLEINVVLAGPGSVQLSPLRIEQLPHATAAAPHMGPALSAPAGPGADYDTRPALGSGTHASTTPGAWWDDRAGRLIGAFGGIVLGFLGALLGTLAGLGKARRLVLPLAVGVSLCGLASLALGFVALGLGQPYAVYYPLALGGGIATSLFGGLLPVIWRRYEAVELRRMTAMDVAPAGK
jgi:hypothetical protein